MSHINPFLPEEVIFLEKNKVLKTRELAKKFDCSEKTIIRRLKGSNYLRSYNKNGSFLTLPETPIFNMNGLWQYEGAYFSKWKTIKETIYHLVDKSDSGLTAGEVIRLLHIDIYHQLTVCVKSGKTIRDKTLSPPVYYSIDHQKRSLQRKKRKEKELKDSLAVIKVSKELTIKILVVALKHHTTKIQQLVPLLQSEDVQVSENQVEYVFDKYNIKKKDSHSNS